MKIKKILIILFIITLPLYIYADGRYFSISGIVLDSLRNQPLPNVYVSAGKIGVQTNSKGEFVINNIPEGIVNIETKYYSAYTSFKKEIKLHSNIKITIKLLENLLPIDEVVVTGTRTEKRLSNSPVLTAIIREREIRKSGSVSLLESLQDNIPGIVISPNAMGNNMRIRGLNSRYILFLVDGERLPSEGAGGNINLAQIDVNNIERVETINGAASALYGSNAIGSVINIITKKPKNRFEGGGLVSYENNNTIKSGINLGFNKNKFSGRINVFNNSSDGFGGDDTGPYAAKYKDLGADLKLAYKINNRFNMGVNANIFRHEIFNKLGVLNTVHPLAYNIRFGGNGFYISPDKKNSVKLSVSINSFLDYDVLEQFNDRKDKENSVGYMASRLQHSLKINDKLELVDGIEYNREENFATKTLGKEPTTRAINDMNVFGQIEYKITRKFNLLLGTRYTYNSQYKSVFTPKLSFMYKHNGFIFRGGVGSAFRAPSIKELYYDFDHQGMFWIFGNPNLKSERGIYSSASIEYTWKLFNISISGYHNSIKDKITLFDIINSKGLNEKHYDNVNKATLRGIDLSLSYILFKQFVSKINYSFCDAKDVATGLQLGSNVKHSLTSSFTWNGNIMNNLFSIQISGRINSPKLYQTITKKSDGTKHIEYNESKSYSIWKLTIVKPFHIKRHSIEATFKVDNLFNFKEISFIDSGRKFLFGLRYSFN